MHSYTYIVIVSVTDHYLSHIIFAFFSFNVIYQSLTTSYTSNGLWSLTPKHVCVLQHANSFYTLNSSLDLFAEVFWLCSIRLLPPQELVGDIWWINFISANLWHTWQSVLENKWSVIVYPSKEIMFGPKWVTCGSLKVILSSKHQNKGTSGAKWKFLFLL